MTITAAHFAKVLKYGTMFKQGLECTVLLSACTVLFGFIIAMLLALMMLSNVYPLHFLAKTKCKSEKSTLSAPVFQYFFSGKYFKISSELLRNIPEVAGLQPQSPKGSLL